METRKEKFQDLSLKKSNHGGSRKGAGRHSKYGTISSVIRVPCTEKKNIKIQMDMLSAYIENRPYSYSASEIYEVLEQFYHLVCDVKSRIETNCFPDLDELEVSKRNQLINIKFIF